MRCGPPELSAGGIGGVEPGLSAIVWEKICAPAQRTHTPLASKAWSETRPQRGHEADDGAEWGGSIGPHLTFSAGTHRADGEVLLPRRPGLRAWRPLPV